MNDHAFLTKHAILYKREKETIQTTNNQTHNTIFIVIWYMGPTSTVKAHYRVTKFIWV